MKPKALIVEDDERIIKGIEHLLFSIGHDHVWVTNQLDAQERLKAEEFAYVFLDLQIPAKPEGLANKAFGIHLLEFIQKLKGPGQLPVFMMTANTADCLELSTELHEKGVWFFISKPLEEKGRMIAQLIQKVLSEQKGPPAKGAAGKRAGPRQQFQGGDVVFHKERVELNGTKICGHERQGKIRKVLDLLRGRSSLGEFLSLTGWELSEKCGASGQNAIARMIGEFRRRVVNILKRANIDIGLEDLIETCDGGYRLAAWITVRDGDEDTWTSGNGHVQVKGQDDRVNVQVKGRNVRVNDRVNVQVWGKNVQVNRRDRILAELKKGGMRLPALAAALKCSTKTVQRELDGLKADGLVRFDGPPKSGEYVLNR